MLNRRTLHQIDAVREVIGVTAVALSPIATRSVDTVNAANDGRGNADHAGLARLTLNEARNGRPRHGGGATVNQWRGTALWEAARSKSG